MVILLEIRPWRLLYILRGSWSYGNITRDKTMASFVHLEVPGLMEILLQIRPWRLLYFLRGSWSYGNITRDKTMASFVHLKRFLVLW